MTSSPAEPRPVPEAEFRRTLAELAGGVVVVTSRGPGDAPLGLTATSVCSVSLAPPLVLACVSGESATGQAIRASGRFALNFLAEGQRSLASRFAVPGVRKFEELGHRRGELGLPLLDGCLATCECTLERTVEAGDHAIFIGRVVAARAAEDGAAPLLWFRRGYGRLAPHSGETG
ncbi:MAG: flavin reductase family protein [Gemmatimonadota bacterium]|jgi:flavin reductase (DIM6/NTAB) family NADH-FMN oxidoreductase RutF